jgi:hypothetical protein
VQLKKRLIALLTPLLFFNPGSADSKAQRGKCFDIVFGEISSKHLPDKLRIRRVSNQEGLLAELSRHRQVVGEMLGLSGKLSEADMLTRGGLELSYRSKDSLHNRAFKAGGLRRSPNPVFFPGNRAPPELIFSRRDALMKVVKFYERLVNQNSAHDLNIDRVIMTEIKQDIIRELSERAIALLVAEGIDIEVSFSEAGYLTGRILPLNGHRVNRVARWLDGLYEGCRLIVQQESFDDLSSSYKGLENELQISPYDLAFDFFEGSSFLHELRHVHNAYYAERDFGEAIVMEPGGGLLPGSVENYSRYLGGDELEAYSVSMRVAAKGLLRSTKSRDREEVWWAEDGLVAFLESGLEVLEGFEKIIGILERYKGRTLPVWSVVDYQTDSEVYAKVPLSYKDREGEVHRFHYTLPVGGLNLDTPRKRTRALDDKIKHLGLLTRNYRAQFMVAAQAASTLSSDATLREKAAVAEGLISITRPHYWGPGGFEVVTMEMLIERYNSVVADRLARFSNIPDERP